MVNQDAKEPTNIPDQKYHDEHESADTDDIKHEEKEKILESGIGQAVYDKVYYQSVDLWKTYGDPQEPEIP